MPEKLAQLLVDKKAISPEQLTKAVEAQKKEGTDLGSAVLKLGYVGESELLSLMSTQYGVPSIDLADFEADPETIKLVPANVARKYMLIPLSTRGSTLIVAMADPSDIFALDDIKFLTGYRIESMVALEKTIKDSIDRYYDSSSTLADIMSDMESDGVEMIEGEEDVDLGALKDASEEAPVIKLVNAILLEAIKKKASDIHVEPYEKSFRVRIRMDGALYDAMSPPMKMKNAIISRIKIMSKLDIAERRLPQDGRIKLKLPQGQDMDFRVSVLPTLFGEKVVMRLLDKSNLQLDMTKLGFEEAALNNFLEAIHRPYGMVLVTGPTGSGKTTTLYSAISELNKITENISTAEDPVEFNLGGVNQVQIHEEIGLTFAGALRSFLRQDPDIILVGEIRDLETGEIAIKAALTGHLVLSTLHTNDAPSTVSRLLNMGIEPFMVASSINLALAQRLARKNCPECKEPIEIPQEALIDLGAKPEEIEGGQPLKGKGCNTCNGTGLKGRIALYEVMPITESLKDLIIHAAPATEIKKEAIKCGMKTLRMSGISKVLDGTTTVEEVLKVTAKD